MKINNVDQYFNKISRGKVEVFKLSTDESLGIFENYNKAASYFCFNTYNYNDIVDKINKITKKPRSSFSKRIKEKIYIKSVK